MFFGGPSGRHQAHGVLDQARVHIHPAAFTLQGCQLLGGGHSTHCHGRASHPLYDDELFFIGRVVHQHLHHETVHLGFGQRVSAFGFNRVLRGHHQEGVGHLVGFPGNGDLALLHHFQQSALHFGWRAVDFIGQQQIGKHRPQGSGKLAGFLVVNPGAHQISGHEVGRELDTFEVTPHRVGKRLHRQCFGQPWHAFHQQVALCQHGHHDAFEETVLAHDDAFDLVEDLLHELGGFSALRGSLGHGVFLF